MAVLARAPAELCYFRAVVRSLDDADPWDGGFREDVWRGDGVVGLAGGGVWSSGEHPLMGRSVIATVPDRSVARA